MLVDVDGLKRLNDEHGHSAGDRAIQCVAAAITHTLRGSDFGARWGGDEFAIIAPNASPGAASASAGRLAAKMRERGAARGERSVTISIGIVSFDPSRHAADEDELVRAADHALYVAKTSGGSAICAFEGVGRDRVPHGQATAAEAHEM
jgi:two-component system cell cycle response regulator